MRRNVGWIGTLVVVLGCSGTQTDPLAQQDQPAAAPSPVFLPEDGPTEADHPELHNLLQISGTIYSGAEPKTEAAFQQLAELGVKTIVNVDGARPNVELAARHGMRYVHIPIGYDRIEGQEVAAFARVADEIEGKMYVHCHHGKHRGPAAAACICVATGQIDGVQALEILEKAGTSEEYPGLWRDVEGYRRPSADAELPKLVAVARVESIPAAMAGLDRASDNLKLCRQAGWSVPGNHPDLVLTEEAKRMVQGLTATREHLAGEYDNDELKAWLAEATTAARHFEQDIRLEHREAATLHFEALQQSCNKCHAKYRNK